MAVGPCETTCRPEIPNLSVAPVRAVWFFSAAPERRNSALRPSPSRPFGARAGIPGIPRSPPVAPVAALVQPSQPESCLWRVPTMVGGLSVFRRPTMAWSASSHHGGGFPADPVVGEAWTGASTDHVVTRTVRDSAAMLDVLSGPASGDPFRIPAPQSSWLDAMQQSPGQLKIGVFTSSPYDTEVAPECVAAVEETARMLEGLGHQVEYARPEFDGLALARCYLALYFGEVSAMAERAREQFGATDKDFELETRLLAMLGQTMPLPDYVRRRQQWNDFARALGAYFDRFDLYLCPTAGQLPARIGELDTPAHMKVMAKLMLTLKAGRLVHRSGQVDQMAMESLARTPFTQL